MDSNGSDPVNPCKRRCKGLGLKREEFETSADTSTAASPSSSQQSSASDSSRHSQVDQDVHMPQTTTEQMQDPSAPNQQEQQDTASLLPQPDYPVAKQDAQQTASGIPTTMDGYNAYASLVAVQEFNQKTAQEDAQQEGNNGQSDAGEVGGNGAGDGNGIDGNGIDGNGIDGNGIDGNGIDGNGIHGLNGSNSGHSSPLQRNEDPSQQIAPQIQPYPQPTASNNHLAIDQPGDLGYGIKLEGNVTNGNGIYGQNGLQPMNFLGQQSTLQQYGQQTQQIQNQTLGGYNQINPFPFNNHNSQNGFGGTSTMGNTFAASNGAGGYNPAQNGIGNNGEYTLTGQSMTSPIPQYYGQRPFSGYSNSPSSQPSTPPSLDSRRIKKEHQDSARLGTWQAGSSPLLGYGGTPSRHIKSEIKSEIKTEIKSETNGHGSKFQRPNGKGTNPSKRIIDLTKDDDDDCVVVGQTRALPPPRPPMQRPQWHRPGEVCFGMIKHALVMAHKVPTPRIGVDRFPDTGKWPVIPICLCRVADKSCTLAVRAIDCSRTEFGCLEIATARGIAPLLDIKDQLGLRLQPRIYPRKRVQGEVAGKEFPDGPQSITIYINVYGQERSAGYVGTLLHSKQINLIYPSQPDPVPILNPHDPRNAAIVNAQLRQMNPYGLPAIQLVAPTPTNVTTVTTRRNEPTTSDIIELLEHLERWKELPEMEQDEKIVTPLLPHQKVGLAFMTARESDPVHDGKGGSLWVHEKSGTTDIWKHSITDDILEKPPPPCYGGILADVMGLGKTLSILSLIASTTDKAAEYGKFPKFKGANKNMVTPVKTTLLVAPVSTMSNWEEQILQHTKPDSLTFYVYHGAKRETNPEVLKNYDVVITTYTIIAGEMKNGKKTPFREMAFFRIVLDEAHTIRQQKTFLFKGINAIEGQRRWAVTGTPIQNRLKDLLALLAFVRVAPFDDKRVFGEYIEQPFKESNPICIERVRKLVDSITMRRQKDRINLPEREDITVTLPMDPSQRELYEATRKIFDNRVTMAQKAGKLGSKNHIHVLKMILCMRLICAHERDLLGDNDVAGMTSSDAIDVDELEDKQPGMNAKQAYETFNLIKDTGTDICEICQSKIESLPDVQSNDAKGVTIGYLTPCNHLLCKDECASKYKAHYPDFSLDVLAPCCLCSEMIRLELFELKEGGAAALAAASTGKGDKKVVKYRGPSVKVRRLIGDLMVNRKEGTPEDPVKSIVFSSWTSHMDLIGKAFDENNITWVRLDGTMNFLQRKAAIARFRDDPSVEVMIISIGAGGLGLNLTCAQKVYVMEPQFNPAAEAQAIDRVHRLGQKKTVTVTKYIMEDSFEHKIIDLQQKKTDLANLSMSGKLADKKALTLDRFKNLSTLFK